MTWVSALLAVVCLAVGVLHLTRLVVRRDDVLGEASHAAMGFGMAAMFSPAVHPVPVLAWVVVFVLCGAWFAAAAVRTRSWTGDAAHHVVGSGAMLLMLAAGHGAGHEGGRGLVSVVAILLAGYFAWHLLRCVDRLGTPAGTAASPPPARGVGPVGAALLDRAPGPRLVGVAHVVTAATMTIMLLGAL